ncbi:MAG: metal-sulfur cluster assembly factor [Planctomycetales bacterium]|nr:metal-sulfur cluster assembly factor [Planctomycetales bacterium]
MSQPERLPDDAAPSETASPTEPATEAAPQLCEDAVRECMRQVIDPELFVNIVDLGLVYGVDFEPAEQEGQNVKTEMTMTSPACPAGPQLIQQSKMVVQQLPGVAGVEVRIVMDPPWSPDRMTEEARDQLGIF